MLRRAVNFKHRSPLLVRGSCLAPFILDRFNLSGYAEQGRALSEQRFLVSSKRPDEY
jgi:hypothetical protein